MAINQSTIDYGLRIPIVKVGDTPASEIMAKRLGDLLKANPECDKAEKAANEVLASPSLYPLPVTFHIEIDKVDSEGKPRSKETLDITGEGIVKRAEFIKMVRENRVRWQIVFAKDGTVCKTSHKRDEGEAFKAALAAATEAARVNVVDIMEETQRILSVPTSPDKAREMAKASRKLARERK